MAGLTDAVTPWWQAVDEAVESLVAVLTAAARGAHRGSRKRPRGRARPKRGTKGTRRHVAEVIRSHRLAPGVTVDRNTISALFAGHRRLVTNPVLIVAVAQACGIIAGRKLTAKEAARLRSASTRIAKLIARAEAVDRAAARPALPSAPTAPTAPLSPAAPLLLASAAASTSPTPSIPTTPATPSGPSKRPSAAPGGPRRPRSGRRRVGATARPHRHGRRRQRWLTAAAALLVAATAALVAVRVAGPGPSITCQAGTRAGDVLTAPIGDQPVPITPALDFDEMHGSAWHADQDGRTYYWATAGSTADRPAPGGARVRWRFDTGDTWHDCAVTFPASTRDDVRTPAVATTVAGRPVRLQVCLWRDDPYRQQCAVVSGLREASRLGS